MPICSKCRISKAVNDFHFKSKKRNIRHCCCRICYNDHCREKNKIRMREKRRRIRNFLRQYLAEHPCVDCKESDVLVLQFDHVRGEKNMDISRMKRQMASNAKLLEEIAKCEVRCANCHQRKTTLSYYSSGVDSPFPPNFEYDGLGL